MKKITLSILIFFLSQSLFAQNCPSIETIKNLKFSVATNIPWMADQRMWILSTDNFNDQGSLWNLMYAAVLNATDQSQAIQTGTIQFYQKQLIEPVKTVEKDRTVCTYTAGNDVETMRAYNPPQLSLEDWRPSSPDANSPKQLEPLQNLQGRWFHGTAQTSISSNSLSSYTFCNEDGNCGFGSIVNYTISVPVWGVTGILSHDGRSIEWSNGTRWERH